MSILLLSIGYGIFYWKKCPSYATIHIQQHSIHSRFSLNVLEIYILFTVCFNYEIIMSVCHNMTSLMNNISLIPKLAQEIIKNFL